MAVSSGIYGFAGVLIGGGLTWLSQWTLAARSDWRDARAARRQVRTELERIRSSADWFVEGSFLRGEKYAAQFRRDDKWAAYSDRLARELSDADWDAVRRAYDAADSLAFWVEHGKPGEVDDAERKAVATIDAALQRLRRRGYAPTRRRLRKPSG